MLIDNCSRAALSDQQCCKISISNNLQRFPTGWQFAQQYCLLAQFAFFKNMMHVVPVFIKKSFI